MKECSYRGREIGGCYVCQHPKAVHEFPGLAEPETCESCLLSSDTSRGIGDTIAKITTAVGIKPCGGCKKRQEKLNDLFPYV